MASFSLSLSLSPFNGLLIEIQKPVADYCQCEPINVQSIDTELTLIMIWCYSNICMTVIEISNTTRMHVADVSVFTKK